MKRECGECTLCCKLVPVQDNKMPLHKKAGERCPHQRRTGCSIYWKRPMGCKLWTCRWLTGEAAELRRPDRSHYVVDTLPDYVTDADTGNKIPVVQVWCDKNYPFAYRDPDLIAYLERLQMPALVRFNNERGVLLVPPCRSDTGSWYEKESIWCMEQQHTLDEINQALAIATIKAL